MRRYRGVCVGGIADGVWQESDDIRIRVTQMKKKPGEKEQVAGESVYKFLLLLGTSNLEVGVWALEGMRIEQVVQRLVQEYNPGTSQIIRPH